MRRNSVVFKLFIVTTTLILIVFSSVMLAEVFFFEKFYHSSKVQTLEENMIYLKDQINKEELNEQQINEQIASFMNQNDATISILNEHFNHMPIEPYFIELNVDQTLISIRIPNEGMEVGSIPQELEIGNTLVIDGIFIDEKNTILQPVEINPPKFRDVQMGLSRVQGKVTDFLLPEQRSYNPLYQDTLIDEVLNDWIPNSRELSLLKDGSIVQRQWQDKWSGVNYIVLTSSLGDKDRYLMVMASLQPVGEAVEVLKQYFILIAPIVIGLVIILSMIYSRIVSRPIRMLSRSATRLAKLDFSEQIEIHSKDEFGGLARDMNSLSNNLQAALNDLTLANGKLQEEIKEKQQAEKLRKQLIANLSHELKTPLGIIKGFTEGLQDNIAKEKSERYLSLIVSETDRMNALILDMLELSKYEAKAIRLQMENFSLTELIQNVAESFSQQLESKRLLLSFDFEADQILVIADYRRMEQVILNLLSNAIRHAFEDTIITVSIARTEAGKVTVMIENIGSFIAEEELSNIWEQFYRIENSRNRKSGGTGLGLAIVKHILELHQSEYRGMNTNQGVAFSFTLNEDRGEQDE
ncbi:ATP-binding protein [Psychrobacillus sp. FSL W7-1493]|uniref:sensor histidine kinase n=1 Tax=Psychrobacillus sp. FSL W7-1493 TaxID=2921552 RepID=UPI0030FAD64F